MKLKLKQENLMFTLTLIEESPQKNNLAEMDEHIDDKERYDRLMG